MTLPQPGDPAQNKEKGKPGFAQIRTH